MLNSSSQAFCIAYWAVNTQQQHIFGQDATNLTLLFTNNVKMACPRISTRSNLITLKAYLHWCCESCYNGKKLCGEQNTCLTLHLPCKLPLLWQLPTEMQIRYNFSLGLFIFLLLSPSPLSSPSHLHGLRCLSAVQALILLCSPLAHHYFVFEACPALFVSAPFALVYWLHWCQLAFCVGRLCLASLIFCNIDLHAVTIFKTILCIYLFDLSIAVEICLSLGWCYTAIQGLGKYPWRCF